MARRPLPDIQLTVGLTSTPAKDDLVRIVDESGEDYLYHKGLVVFVDFPKVVKKKILVLATAA